MYLTFSASKHKHTYSIKIALYKVFKPHVLKPTRIASHSFTLIDNIFFNSIEYQTISGNLLRDLTDHLPNFLIIERFAFSRHKEKKYKQDYSYYNEEAFIDEFSSIDSGLIYFMDSQILLKCLISFIQK